MKTVGKMHTNAQIYYSCNKMLNSGLHHNNVWTSLRRSCSDLQRHPSPTSTLYHFCLCLDIKVAWKIRQGKLGTGNIWTETQTLLINLLSK